MKIYIISSKQRKGIGSNDKERIGTERKEREDK